MALPILDGNQSATTLSTILSSGQHIPAHTVVSLGTQAIIDISGAVSGSVVSISNFPATQTIAGTVTANLDSDSPVIASQVENGIAGYAADLANDPFPIAGTVTVGNSVTISSLPAISGTVTANGGDGTFLVGGLRFGNKTALSLDGGTGYLQTKVESLPALVAGTAQIGSVTASISNSVTIGSLPLIAGTVTVGNSLTIQSGNISIEEVFGENSFVPISGTVTVGNSVTISSLPAISGTVTATIRNGEDAILNDAPSGYTAIRALSHWFDDVVDNEIKNTSQTNPLPISGTVTIGSLPNGVAFGEQLAEGFQNAGGIDINNDLVIGVFNPSVTAFLSNSVTIASFATSVTARLINPAGTAVTYAEVGTAGSPSIDVLSVQGVTSGTPLTILNHQGTTVTTSNFTSTTASTVLASANSTREVLTIFNEGAGNLHICAGATCTTIAYQVRLSAGDYYEVPLNQTSLTHSAVFATAGTARVTQVS